MFKKPNITESCQSELVEDGFKRTLKAYQANVKINQAVVLTAPMPML